MEAYYVILFLVLGLTCAYLELNKKKGGPGGSSASSSSSAFQAFKNNYLLVYSLMMAGDWLQGPYVYALYQSYGYDRGDIGKLFIAGFGSSLVFGTIAGTMVDKYGRRFGAMAYVVSYALSCVTKHWSSYQVLMVGRLLGGIATSLLFSTFESWLVGEHFKRGYEGAWLSEIFSKAVFLGNGLAAIASGLVGNFLVNSFSEGKVAPFDASIVVLCLGGGIIMATWSENYGDSSSKSTAMDSFQKALKAVMSDRKVALLGAIQPLFEVSPPSPSLSLSLPRARHSPPLTPLAFLPTCAPKKASMYTFVFMWTPAISPNDEPIPHGLIFSVFMLASMVGSSIAGKLLEGTHDNKVPVEVYMQYVFVVAALSLFVPSIISHTSLSEIAADSEGRLSFTGQIEIFAFCIFEACVGLFWPSIMKMRSEYVPEESRATIINIFRIPLNLFVCTVLYNVSLFSVATYLGMCSMFLILAAYCQMLLHRCTKGAASGGSYSAV